MIQVYTRTLSADEVARNYNTTKTRFGLWVQQEDSRKIATPNF
jgi:hypothetical protein